MKSSVWQCVGNDKTPLNRPSAPPKQPHAHWSVRWSATRGYRGAAGRRLSGNVRQIHCEAQSRNNRSNPALFSPPAQPRGLAYALVELEDLLGPGGLVEEACNVFLLCAQQNAVRRRNAQTCT